ncbi:tetratricopeptide (TPR) repeat protein [Sphingobium sp. B7D2B]|uniref:hypothetical protein n=1 Tax=Sphingobium sp. B7D2B TaxID=2940583 RepID=UPI002224E5CF|nr:hypothetical protein [Sphingobium sp. B7D2B]MCW2364588.1 tetratricopeptide (TPR) repeat protein [Sphingobium sp. B7D2B]
MSRTMFLVGVVIATMPGLAMAQTQRFTAYQSNLIATNTYQAEATAREFKKYADDEIRRLYAAAEAGRGQIRSLKARLSASESRVSVSFAALDRAEAQAASAQEQFTAELARRSADYARERRALIEAGQPLLNSETGQRILELLNQDDRTSWERAKAMASDLLKAQDVILSDERRFFALQFLDRRDKGQETSETVIQKFLDVVKVDGSDPTDWIRLTNLYVTVGDMPSAIKAAKQALNVSKGDKQRSLALIGIGDLERVRGDYQAAFINYEAAYEVSKKYLDDASADPEFVLNFAPLMSKFGYALLQVGNTKKAKLAFEEALEMWTELSKDNPDNSAIQLTLAANYADLGLVAEAEGRHDIALQYFIQSQDITSLGLQKDPHSSVWRADQAAILGNLGDANLGLGRLEAARTNYVESVKITEDLARADPASVSHQEHLILGFDRLDDVMSKMGHMREAKSFREKRSAILEALDRAGKLSFSSQRDIILKMFRKGYDAYYAGAIDDAKRLYSDAVQASEWLAKNYGEYPQVSYDLGLAHQVLGQIAFEEDGDLDLADLRFRRSYAILSKAVTMAEHSSETERALAETAQKQGALEIERKNLTVASEKLNEALVIQKRLVSDNPDWRDLAYDLGNTLWSLAKIPKSGVRWKDVVRHLEAMDARHLLADDERSHLEDARRRASEDARQ